MEIKKVRETINRSFENDSQSDKIENVLYNILDDNENVIGTTTVWEGNASVNFTLSGFASIEEGAARVETLFEKMYNSEADAE